MLTNHIKQVLLIAGAALVLTGCSHTASYNASHFDYTPHTFPEQLEGMAAIQMSPTEQAETFTGKPTSFTGGGTSLTLPIGQILREGAVLAFRDMFADGAEAIDSAPNGTAYSAVIKPSVRSFSYEYNQLKNIGFAITPTATISIEVSVAGVDGQQGWTQTVDSGPVEGPAYMVTGSPGEEISKVAHKAVMSTLQKAAALAYEETRHIIRNGTAANNSGGNAL